MIPSKTVLIRNKVLLALRGRVSYCRRHYEIKGRHLKTEMKKKNLNFIVFSVFEQGTALFEIDKQDKLQLL